MALASAILSGCVPKTSVPEFDGTPGRLSGTAGRPGIVVAAPHGISDARTADIVAELGRRTGYGVVIATGFNIEPDTLDRAGRRYEVNRPFEGVPGRPPSEEVATDGARRVYEAYERRVREVAQGPLVFYAEIHGNSHPDAANRIEIATVGVDRAAAERLRTLCELIREAYLQANRSAPRLEILIEPADTIRYAATGAKRAGILRLPRHGMHIELPKAARGEWRETYTAILADFLAQALPLPPGP